MTDIEVVVELGQQLRQLIELAKAPEDPRGVLLGEEIERLSDDEAQALLLVAALMLARYEDKGI
jgi:hypothetical protein